MNEEDRTDSGASPAADLRQEAERRLRKQMLPPVEGMAEADVRALLHELQVHQIELEMQNEELLRAQAALQADDIERKQVEEFQAQHSQRPQCAYCRA